MKNLCLKTILLLCIGLVCRAPIEAQTRLNHMALSVRHLAESTHFYEKLLGLDTIPEPFKDGLHKWLKIGDGAALHLIEVKTPLTVPSKGTHWCFSVASVPDFVTKLRQQKIDFEDWPGAKGQVTTRVDGVHQLYLQDPDGYWIEVNDARQ